MCLEQICGPGLHRTGATTAYSVFHLPKMAYSLGVTTIGAKLDKVQSMANQRFLSVRGHNPHFLYDIAYGPKEMDGLGFVHLQTREGAEAILMLMKHT